MKRKAKTATVATSLRWWLCERIDCADTWVLDHPDHWLAGIVRRPVCWLWDWTMRDKDWAAAGEDWEVGDTQIPCEWDSEGNAVDWLCLRNVHERSDTCDVSCVIHHRTGHHMSLWPLLWRGDRGIFERLCDHGIGHPDPDQGPYWKRTDQDWQWVHGCDGCCRKDDDDPPA